MVHECDPQKYRDFYVEFLKHLAPYMWGDRQHTVQCTCTQMLTRPHGITIQKVCFLAGRTKLEAQFSVRSGHLEWWMPLIILYVTDCCNCHIYPAVGTSNLVTSANTIQWPCRNCLLPHLHRTVASVCVSACLGHAAAPRNDKQQHVQFTVVTVTHSYSEYQYSCPSPHREGIQGGVEVQGGCRCRWVLNVTPQALYPKGKSLQFQLIWRQGGP
jgi:hypothetical protein